MFAAESNTVCNRPPVSSGWHMTANYSLQTDKGKRSGHLCAHMARQLAFAAELGR